MSQNLLCNLIWITEVLVVFVAAICAANSAPLPRPMQYGKDGRAIIGSCTN